MLNETQNFRQKVLAIVGKIPKGKVLTYGQVATLAGVPRAARMVGGILQQSANKLPWQRVINRHGKISTYRIGFGHEQKELLEAEGIEFGKEEKIDLNQYQWWPSQKLLSQFELEEELAWNISQKLGF